MKIGLEIHAGVKTATKLFCRCPKKEGEPNTYTCEVCLGHPGSKPVMNRDVFEKGIMTALAFKCKIAKKLIFSRKSYFYPDLAKNYQITQYEEPIGDGGHLNISGKKINLKRIHIEEDPAALVHSGTGCLMDYNRSGSPLFEIVTEPDMETPEEAREFLKKLRNILEYLEVFDSKCVIKADANVSIEESNYTRVEVKNISGFKEIEKAIFHEAERQANDMKNGLTIEQETRGWDSEKGITYPMRKKETEADYGYIIDPDLIPIPITEDMIQNAEEVMPELAEQKISKFKTMGVQATDAEVLAAEKRLANLFEKVAASVDPVLSAKWLRRELVRVLNYNKKELHELEMDESHLIDLLKLVEKKEITDKTAQKLFEKLAEGSFNVRQYVEEKGLKAVTDTGKIKEICQDVIKNNEKAVAEYKEGNQKSFNFLVGQVMARTKGKADPATINQILKELI